MIEIRRGAGGATVPAIAVGLVAVATVLLLGLNCLRGATRCAWGTSNCAYSAQKSGYYAGKLTLTGHPRVVGLALGSRPGARPISLRLDDAGRYCVVWAHERSAVATSLRQGQQFATNGYRSVPLAPWRALGRSGPPVGCQHVTAGVPWNRQSGLESAWQFEALIGVAILGLRLLLVGRAIRPAGLLAFSLAALALLTNAALSFTIWS